jgi:hypothetical protein
MLHSTLSQALPLFPLNHHINISRGKCTPRFPLRFGIDVTPIKIHKEHRDHLGVDSLRELYRVLR